VDGVFDDRFACEPFTDTARSVPAIIRLFDPVRTLSVHHFEQEIAGRTYRVEVVPSSNRWRARLRRGPGVPTAMMPFYGETPEEAANQLLRWLSLAHAPAANSVRYSPGP